MAMDIQLEAAAEAFVEATGKPPFWFEQGAAEGRMALERAQAEPAAKLPAVIKDLTVAGGPTGEVTMRILRPQSAPCMLPVILYAHGGGWVFGSEQTHDCLIRELAVGAEAVIVFPKYSRAPEHKYPAAIEEIYAAAEWIAHEGAAHGLDAERLVVAGDGAGGNLAAVTALRAKARGTPNILAQLLFYPVTDAGMDTASYVQFGEGYYLRREAMEWFWEQYLNSPAERVEIMASPLRASVEQLQGLPPALIITAEADVLRDEGEAYANKLRAAGVHVTAARFQGTIHDFVMLNALAESDATRGALDLATRWLRDAFGN